MVKLINGVNSKAKIIVHRDRDFLNDTEVEDWKKSIRALKCEPFVTAHRDIESYLLNIKYLASLNQDALPEKIQELIEKVFQNKSQSNIENYVNSRIDFLRKEGKANNPGQIATEANKLISADPKKYNGKISLRTLRSEYQREFSKNLLTNKPSSELIDAELSSIARRVFGNSKTAQIKG